MIEEARLVFHDFTFRPESLKFISTIEFKNAWKLVLLSATIGTMTYEPVLKILKYKTKLHNPDEGDTLPIYYNLINSTPLQHADKQFLKVKQSSKIVSYVQQ